MVVLKSDVPPWEVPVLPVYDYTFQNVHEYSDKIALVDAVTEDQLTFKQYVDQIEQLASGLWELGVRPGTVVGVFSPNSIQYCVLFFAVLRIGATLTTANPSYTANELRHQIKDSGAGWMFTTADLVSTVVKAGQGCPKLKEILTLDESNKSHRSYLDVLKTGRQQAPRPRINPKKDLAVIPYSSGTTGRSKGVMLTHYNVVAAVDALSPGRHPLYDLDPNVLSYLPLYHIYGLTHNHCFCAKYGAKQILVPRFEPHLFCSVIQKYQITLLKLVPATAVFLAKSPVPKEYDLSSLEHVNSGGAPLGPGTEQELYEAYGATIRQGWGMTENVGCSTASPKNGKPGAVGKLLGNAEVKVVDPETGLELGPGDLGEIWFRAPYNMKGYLNNPKATAETLTKDGWLKTGDLGKFDEDGYVFVTDRLKELIKVKAFQVAPAELEDLLLTHPEVADVAVIGVLDEKSGELPKAFIVKKPDSRVTAMEIRKFVSGKVAPYKQLGGGVEFISEIPKSPSGKILRRNLRDRQQKAKL